MNVKFISTTNNLAECIVGQTIELSYSRIASFIYNPEGLGFDYRKGRWSTSHIININVKEISRNCYIIKIDTKNSQYVFQDGEKSDLKPYTDEELLAMRLSFGLF